MILAKRNKVMGRLIDTEKSHKEKQLIIYFILSLLVLVVKCLEILFHFLKIYNYVVAKYCVCLLKLI